MKHTLFFIIAIVSLAMSASPLWQVWQSTEPERLFSLAKPLPTKQASSTPIISHQFASHGSTPEVHSATAIELDNNDIMAFWYGGTREGHKDVAIYQNIWRSNDQQWQQEHAIVTRAHTQNGTSRYIRKLGNPVVTRASDHSIWLFYVSVSIGGWAGSSINLTRSYDEGKSWSTPKRLISSPFLNLSTLIKGSAIHYSDGSIGLPVYHELIGKFGELLKIDKQGNVIDKSRMSWGQTSLQPIIFPLSTKHAVAMMRYQGKPPNKILKQESNDAGVHWSKTTKSVLPNPGAGIMGLVLNDTTLSNHSTKQIEQILLLAFNNDPKERDDMTLAISSDQAQTWQIMQTIESNKLIPADNSQQFSYPWLLQTQNGTIHLLYTWHKNHIKHVVFNYPWLLSKAPKQTHSLHAHPTDLGDVK